MPRASVTKPYYSFLAGKVSDGSALTPPENSARILENIDLETSGEISRRLGLDYEENYQLSSEVFTEEDIRLSGVGFYEWLNVAEDGRRNFFVVRVGETLYIYNQSGTSISGNRLGTVDISIFSIDLADSKKSELHVASGKGILFCTGELYEPFYLEYDVVNETISATVIAIEVRDFKGIEEEGVAVDERPSILTDHHHYNLLNQGWRTERLNRVAYPSNADVMTLGMKVNDDGDRVFAVPELTSNDFGNTPAPKGHFILDAFNPDRISASGVAGLIVETVNRRPRSVGFYSGRVWYGAVKGKVYFSQILDDIEKIGYCYQEQDPTAEDFNELLDTDGGVMHIPELGEVYKLANIASSLLVMANNGIWSISGGTDNFTANTSKITKISEIGLVNGRSVVTAGNATFFWSEEGIFVVAVDNTSGELVVNSLSDNRINNDYFAIPAISRLAAQGSYDRVNKLIMWSYHDGLSSTATAIDAKYNSILIYNLTLNAFYDYRIEDVEGGYSSFMAGIVKGSARNEGTNVENVTANTVLVTADGVIVTVTATFTGAEETPARVLTFASIGETWKLTFSGFTSRTFHDWYSMDNVGANYTSIVETNPETVGDPSVNKQATYLYSFYDYKRNGFGHTISDPRIDVGKGFRVSQNVVEVLRKGDPQSRVTQNIVETLKPN